MGINKYALNENEMEDTGKCNILCTTTVGHELH